MTHPSHTAGHTANPAPARSTAPGACGAAPHRDTGAVTAFVAFAGALLAVVGTVLVLAGLHHAGGALLFVATVAAVGVLTRSDTLRQRADGYTAPSNASNASRQAGNA